MLALADGPALAEPPAEYVCTEQRGTICNGLSDCSALDAPFRRSIYRVTRTRVQSCRPAEASCTEWKVIADRAGDGSGFVLSIAGPETNLGGTRVGVLGTIIIGDGERPNFVWMSGFGASARIAHGACVGR